MPRDVPEWIGRDDNEPVPLRVRLRVLIRANRLCAGCTRIIRPGDEWTCDHKVALINGGPNRETNLQPLCEWCDPQKTARDVAEKSKVARMAAAHAGIRRRVGRPMIGTKASGWRKRMDGTVERR